MADPDTSLPYILTGKYFEVVQRAGAHVEAVCKHCPEGKNIYRGTVNTTSNFVTHLRRKHENLLETYEEEMQESGRNPKGRRPKVEVEEKGTPLPVPIDKVKTETVDDVEGVEVNESKLNSLILNGKYFEVVEVNGSHVEAICKHCPDGKNIYRGSVHTTSNFLKHLRRKHEDLLESYEEELRVSGRNCKGRIRKPTVRGDSSSSHQFKRPSMDTVEGSDSKNVCNSLILSGKYFEVVRVEGTHVVAVCKHCPEGSNIYRGSVLTTSNFLKHLRRRHENLLETYMEEMRSEGRPKGRRPKVKASSFSVSYEFEEMNSVPNSTPKCLFCFEPCSEWEDLQNQNIEIEVPGAVQCTELRHQLLEFFILRKLLDVEVSWFGENLLRKRMEKAEVESLKICAQCVALVEKGWNLHQQILSLETQLNGVKASLKEGMRGAIERDRRGNDSSRMNVEVRKILFPELLQLQSDSQYGKYSDVDTDFANADCDQDSTVDDVDWNPELPASLPPNGLVRRKRGRPLGSRTEKNDYSTKQENGEGGNDPKAEIPRFGKRRRERPSGWRKTAAAKVKCALLQRLRRKQEGFYYDHYGVLKQKKFHWSICEKCGSRFKEEGLYQDHMDLHAKREETGVDVELNCPQCGFPAPDEAELEVHTSNRHSVKETKWWRCPEENCTFRAKASYRALKNHVESAHPTVNLQQEENSGEGEKGKVISDFLLKCTACSLTFENARIYLHHQRQVHGKGSKKCPKCPKVFANNNSLNCHILRVHQNRHRLICEECGAGFQHLSQLRQHTSMKHGERVRHMCDICGLDYVAAYHLKKHIERFHSNENGSDTSTAQLFKCQYCTLTSPYKVVIKRHLEVHKEEMGHKCELCGKFYTNEQGLKRHLRIIHSSEKVQCPFCKKFYPSVEYMRSHQLKYCQEFKKFNEQKNDEGMNLVNSELNSAGYGNEMMGTNLNPTMMGMPATSVS